MENTDLPNSPIEENIEEQEIKEEDQIMEEIEVQDIEVQDIEDEEQPEDNYDISAFQIPIQYRQLNRIINRLQSEIINNQTLHNNIRTLVQDTNLDVSLNNTQNTVQSEFIFQIYDNVINQVQDEINNNEPFQNNFQQIIQNTYSAFSLDTSLNLNDMTANSLTSVLERSFNDKSKI